MTDLDWTSDYDSIYIYPGEYPAADYEVDGFTQRLLDYAEFERYEDSDPLR